jgi:hypothetical protein
VDGRSTARGSLIVPAYNEEDRIGPLLPVLGRAAEELGCVVVVACNGCGDSTAEMARATRGLTVLEDDVASKPRALNRAERYLGDVFPRLYVDADVRTDIESLKHLVEALQVEEPRAVHPRSAYDMAGAPWLARAFYESREIVPSTREWLRTHVEGHHIYGTNRAGRAKFDVFPEAGQIMEDAFFDRMFEPDEKLAVDDALVYVPLPTSTRALLRGMTRVYQGNWELDEWLRENRPDRLPSAQHRSTSRSENVRALLRDASGADDTPGVSPVHALTVLAGAVLARQLASANARRLNRRGRQADWR